MDAYDFYRALSDVLGLDKSIIVKSNEIKEAIDRLVVHSYYGSGYLPETNRFIDGKSGAYQILPLGSKIYSESQQSYWPHTTWFHPEDKLSNESYGQYSWCVDGATPCNKKVDNFFELLDYFFDSDNDATGGYNKYQW